MDERILYGNNQLGYDLARFDNRSKVRRTIIKNEVRVAPKSRAAARTSSIGLWQVAIFFFIMSVVLIIVFSYATLSEISRTNAALTKQLTDAQKQCKVLSAALETRIMLDEVSDIAVSKLGMVKPDRQQIVYIDLSGPEKVEINKRHTGIASVTNRLNTALEDMLEYFR